MWSDLERGFQAAFEAAWASYRANSLPIGSAVCDTNENILAVGRNQIRTSGDGILSHHQLAHAEANAILQLSEETEPNLHPDIRTYTLYATLEPCPFCFGAIVVGSIRNLRFAARDGIGGATALNGAIDYIRRKNISIQGPFAQPELAQLALLTCFELERGRDENSGLLNAYRQDCPRGFSAGVRLAKEGGLRRLALGNAPFAGVYDGLLSAGEI